MKSWVPVGCHSGWHFNLAFLRWNAEPIRMDAWTSKGCVSSEPRKRRCYLWRNEVGSSSPGTECSLWGHTALPGTQSWGTSCERACATPPKDLSCTLSCWRSDILWWKKKKIMVKNQEEKKSIWVSAGLVPYTPRYSVHLQNRWDYFHPSVIHKDIWRIDEIILIAPFTWFLPCI